MGSHSVVKDIVFIRRTGGKDMDIIKNVGQLRSDRTST
jgi:hypothetical protein